MIKKINILIVFLFSIGVSLLYSQVLELNDAFNIALEKSYHARISKLQDKINILQYKTTLNSLKPNVSMSITGPSYSHSITGVTQPDGSIKYLDVNSLSTGSSLSISSPILFTGGSLNIQSYLNYYKNKSFTSSQSFSANFYKITLSQPLSLYNSYKWQKKIAEAELPIKKISIWNNYTNIKKNTTSKYFKLLEILKKKELLVNRKKILSDLLNKYELLTQKEKIRKLDLLELQIRFEEISDEIMSIDTQRFIAEQDLFFYLGISKYNEEHILLLPPILKTEINSNNAKSLLHKKHELIFKASELSAKNEVEKAKSQKGLNGSLNLSIGLNSSSDKFKNIFDDKIPNENIALSVSIPIFDWGVSNNRYKIAQYSYENKRLDIEAKQESETIELNNYILQLETSRLKHTRLLDRKKLTLEELRISKLLFEHNQISFKEFEDIQNKVIEFELSIISELKNVYTYYFLIESITLYDYVNNVGVDE